MKPTRVLVLSLVLSGLVIRAVGQTLSGGAPDSGDTGHEWRGHPARDNQTTQLFRLMGRDTIWTHVETIKMTWPTFHTQGLVKIGETFYVSAVEVIESTVRNGAVTDALYDFSLDRSPGAGRGWLFKFDPAGQLLGQIELTDGAKYHPGGIDYDGQSIWVPVAEYRPNSTSNIYRVDPETLASELVFAANDHIGGHRAQPAPRHAPRRELGVAAALYVDGRWRGRQSDRRVVQLGPERAVLHRLSRLPLPGDRVHAVRRGRQL